MNEQQDLFYDLEYFGLSADESTLYLAMLRYGPIPVGLLAKKTELDRGKVYRMLDHLQGLGVVKFTFSNPVKCIAAKPDECLNNIVQKKECEVETMKKLIPRVNSSLKSVSFDNSSTQEHELNIVQGRNIVYAHIAKLISNARNTVYIVSSKEDLIRMYYTQIPEIVKKAKKQNIKVRILTEKSDPKEESILQKFEAEEIRYGILPSKSRMIVEERRKLIMSGLIDETSGHNDSKDSILDTNSPEMVSNISRLCILLWNRARRIMPNQ
ncbi:helix-turn-helix domain-containing protein [Nitrosopumilus sp. b1]|uniref:TrmB family transcriptional regulator n=1 Tax=Nitrosopumilus sp. b1 TaxID=2109907 RepID=UPI0015F4ED6E|nr:helix-turn-helix domain-containing protein [Nitrosopumilus sp. b1]